VEREECGQNVGRLLGNPTTRRVVGRAGQQTLTTAGRTLGGELQLRRARLSLPPYTTALIIGAVVLVARKRLGRELVSLDEGVLLTGLEGRELLSKR
jgi:hypothetical protein